MVLTRQMKRDERARAAVDMRPFISQESPIFKLNDDCLANIFKYLPVRDRMLSELGNIFCKFFQIFIVKAEIN